MTFDARLAWRAPSEDDLAKMSKTGPDGNPSEQMTSAMSKLKDSVNKLRDHLDSLQRRRSLPPMSSSEADQLLSGLRKKSAAHKNKEKASQNKQDAEAKLAVKDSVSKADSAPAKADSAPAKADSTPAVTTSTTTTSTKSSSEKPAKLTNGHGPASDISAQKPEINHKSNHKASRRTVPAAIMAEPEKPLEQSQVQLRQKRRSYIRHDSINKEGVVPLKASQSMQDLSLAGKMPGRPPRNKVGSTRVRLRRSRTQSSAEDTAAPAANTSGQSLAGSGAVTGSIPTTSSHVPAAVNNNVTSNGSQSLTAWEKRKLYDSKRRSLQETDMIAFSMDVAHRSSNNSISPTGSARGGNPSSSRSSSIVSNLSTKSKTRRSLPRVPQGEHELEERRKKMSARAILNARKAQQTNCTPSVQDIPNSLPPEMSYIDKQEEQLIQCELEQVNGGQEVCNFSDEPYMDSRVENYHTQNSVNYHEMNNNPSDKGFTHISMMERDDTPKHVSSHHSVDENTSHAALKRIINDLRDAANRPYEAPVTVTPPETSLSSTSSLTRDMVNGCTSMNGGNGYPAEEGYGSGDNASRIMELDISPLARPAPDYNGLEDDPSDLPVLHPSLHRILMSYELKTIILHNPNHREDPGDYGIDIFEAAYLDCPGREISRNSSFSSPSGRRAIIGRKRGAFMPVCPNSNDAGPMLSLVAVDCTRDYSIAKESGMVLEGDYIIEINGIYVGNCSVDVIQSEMRKQQHTLQLVVARPKAITPTYTDQNQHGNFADLLKEVEKLKLKYNSVKQDSEKHLDHVAELRMELQKQQDESVHLESELRRRDQEIAFLDMQCQQKEDSVGQLQFQTSQRDMEVEHLHYELQQREEKILQLRRLLIQQTEVMHLEGLEHDYLDTDYVEKVSAV